MAEFRLKDGSIVKGTVEAEYENGYSLINVLVENPDKSVTSYYRLWVNKDDIIPEKKEEAKVVKAGEAPKKRGRPKKK